MIQLFSSHHSQILGRRVVPSHRVLAPSGARRLAMTKWRVSSDQVHDISLHA